jgi:hypothetical protein
MLSEAPIRISVFFAVAELSSLLPCISLYKVIPRMPQKKRNRRRLSDNTAPYEQARVIRKYG